MTLKWRQSIKKITYLRWINGDCQDQHFLVYCMGIWIKILSGLIYWFVIITDFETILLFKLYEVSICQGGNSLRWRDSRFNCIICDSIHLRLPCEEGCLGNCQLNSHAKLQVSFEVEDCKSSLSVFITLFQIDSSYLTTRLEWIGLNLLYYVALVCWFV